MNSALRYSLLLVSGVALGCGPAVATTGTEGGSSTSTGGVDPNPASSTTTPGETGATTTSREPQGTSSSGLPSTSSADSSSESGPGFLEPVDTDGAATCDAYLQDCPDAEKCNPYADDGGGAWNALGCFPVVPAPNQPGEPCETVGGGTSGFDTCDVGSMCWNVDTETNIGSCVAMCEGSIDAPVCSDLSTTCSIANEGVLNLCLLSCDPQGDDCPEGETCYELEAGPVCAPTAAPAPGAPGTSCDNIASCDLGAICVTAAAHGPGCDGQGCCTEVCELSDPLCENPNQVCQEWFEEGMVPPGFEGFGVCMVPM